MTARYYERGSPNKGSIGNKKYGKDQETIQSSTAPDPGHHMRKYQNTINITNKSQEVSPFPAGDHKAAVNRRKCMRNTTYITQKYHLGTVSKNILLEGLNRFHGALTSSLVQMRFKTHRCLVCMKDPNLLMHHLLDHINQDIKRR